jgi:glycosyltransferase involved in cell wall biosynthesis
MCTYNASRYVEQELESFTRQTRLPDELVVCDNVSSDNTIELLENFRRRAPFPVRIFRNDTNIGRSRNFTKSVGLCEGDYIATADFDDIWLPDRIQQMCDALDAEPNAGYAFSEAELIDGDGRLLPGNLRTRSNLRLIEDFPPEKQAEILFHDPIVTGSTLVIRAGLRSLVLPISTRWIQDYWITLLASLAGSYGILLPQPTIQYRLHASQEIGIPNPERTPMQVVQSINSWRGDLEACLDLSERLRAFPDMFARGNPRVIAELESKIEHYQTRLRANAAPHWRKPAIVFGEMKTGRYRQFSGGWLSIARDLVV